MYAPKANKRCGKTVFIYRYHEDATMKKQITKILALSFASTLATAFFTADAFAFGLSNSGDPVPVPRSAGAPNIYAPYAEAEAVVQFGALTSAKGFSVFSHPATGIYCLKLPAGTHPTAEPVVSIEWGASTGVALYAQYYRGGADCPVTSPRTIEIQTYKGDVGGVGSALQIPVLSDQVAFVVLVP